MARISVASHATPVGGCSASPDSPVDVVVHCEVEAPLFDWASFAELHCWYGFGVVCGFRKEVNAGVTTVRIVLPGHVVVFEVEGGEDFHFSL